MRDFIDVLSLSLLVIFLKFIFSKYSCNFIFQSIWFRNLSIYLIPFTSQTRQHIYQTSIKRYTFPSVLSPTLCRWLSLTALYYPNPILCICLCIIGKAVTKEMAFGVCFLCLLCVNYECDINSEDK